MRLTSIINKCVCVCVCNVLTKTMRKLNNTRIFVNEVKNSI
jgi:hypothetical protein